jgi:hypothetical protein
MGVLLFTEPAKNWHCQNFHSGQKEREITNVQVNGRIFPISPHELGQKHTKPTKSSRRNSQKVNSSPRIITKGSQKKAPLSKAKARWGGNF